MAERVQPIPTKLKHDAIVEALVELRFDLPPKTVPEVLFGRLAEYTPWKDFEQRALPASQLPAPIRQTDPNLRFAPLFELAAPDKRSSVRIGPHALSYHRLSPYVGWVRLAPELRDAVEGLFSKTTELTVRRLGLRYMNALRADVHGIRSILDLDLKLVIAGEAIKGNINVNFTTDVTDDTQCTVRIATPEFIQGTLPENTSVYIDVDVFTKNTFKTKDKDTVINWIESAHAKEKEQFFRLLTKDTIDVLKET